MIYFALYLTFGLGLAIGSHRVWYFSNYGLLNIVSFSVFTLLWPLDIFFRIYESNWFFNLRLWIAKNVWKGLSRFIGV